MAATSIFAVGMAVQIILEGGDASWWRWGGLVFWVIMVALSVRRAAGAGRSLRAFEAAHVRDAGRQRPIGA
ncbi:hypothetical protein [Microbacterium sp. BWR-S6Y]|uniref:hypothetical protein n=1 Tax=Microbacterium sp. BWR-S6Y TaxID=3232073 RepID=UPI00352772C2